MGELAEVREPKCSALTTSAYRSCRDWMSRLTDGSSMGTVPARIAKLVPAAIADLEAAMLPATVEQQAPLFDRLFDWAKTFGMLRVTAPDPEHARRQGMALIRHATDHYRANLGHLPPDLLALAIERTMAGHGWRNLPTPAEIGGTVAEELAQRRGELLRLRYAAWRVKVGDVGEDDERTPPTEEQKAKVHRMVAALSAAMRTPAAGADERAA